MAEQDQNKTKKQVPLRLSKTLFDELSAWAQDDFRSLNGQIEYLLTEAVRNRRKKDVWHIFRFGEVWKAAVVRLFKWTTVRAY